MTFYLQTNPYRRMTTAQSAKDNCYQFQWWAFFLAQMKPFGGESRAGEAKLINNAWCKYETFYKETALVKIFDLAGKAAEKELF
jgi:hypothetical protein